MLLWLIVQIKIKKNMHTWWFVGRVTLSKNILTHALPRRIFRNKLKEAKSTNKGTFLISF